MYRVKHRIVPKIMWKLFNEANVPYDLRQDIGFRSYNVKTVLYGTETLSYLGPKIWDFTKRLKNGNQIDVHVGSAKYTFLI